MASCAGARERTPHAGVRMSALFARVNDARPREFLAQALSMSRSSSAHLVTRTRVGIAPALARVEGFTLLALALLVLFALIVGPKLLLSRFVDKTLSGNLEG